MNIFSSKYFYSSRQKLFSWCEIFSLPTFMTNSHGVRMMMWQTQNLTTPNFLTWYCGLLHQIEIVDLLSRSGSRNYSLYVFCQGQLKAKVNPLGLPWTPGAWSYNCNATTHHPLLNFLSKGPSTNGLIHSQRGVYQQEKQHVIKFSTVQY